MLTFKRLIYRERKSSSNPMHLRDLFWSLRSQALFVCVWGARQPTLSKNMGKNPPLGEEKETIQYYKTNIHKPRRCAIAWIPFTNKCKCQTSLADWFCIWTTKLDWSSSRSVSGQFPPRLSGFSTELLPANPRFGHGGRAHLGTSRLGALTWIQEHEGVSLTAEGGRFHPRCVALSTPVEQPGSCATASGALRCSESLTQL